MTRSGLARHLKTCPKRLEAQAAATAATATAKRRGQTLYHLQVQDAYDGYFWLQLEMRGDATLYDLDYYLRAIWLECCGHLSQFKIGSRRYTEIFEDGLGIGDEHSLDIAVEKLFMPGMEIPYEYDFGSTTELIIKVMDRRRGQPTTPHPIVLMGRNKFEPPPCTECDEPATYICTECTYARDRYEFCDAHARGHEHEEYLMALVNSPRTGVCGYSGPGLPPY